MQSFVSHPGKYANNIITKTYKKGQAIKVLVDLTSNHRGYFRFRVGNIGKLPMTEEKLTHVLKQPSGGERWYLKTGSNGLFTISLQLPKDLTCDHCVMQWWYKVGNNWGCDTNGTCGLGHGEKQESFVNCADISITDTVPTQAPTPTKKAPPRPSTRNPNPNTPSNKHPKEHPKKQPNKHPKKQHPTKHPKTHPNKHPKEHPKKQPNKHPNKHPKTHPNKHPNKHTPATEKPTNEPGVSPHPSLCRSAGAWAGMKAVDEWCRRNCAMGFCPATHCTCS